MFKKALLLVALLVLVVFQVPALSAQDGASFGHTWKSFSSKEKEAFLIGIVTAVQLTCEPLALVKGSGSKPAVDQNRFKECFNEFAGMEPGKVIDGMNAFYNDARNAFIPLSGGYRITLMQLRGVKVDDVLVQARKYGDAIKKKLSEEKNSSGK